MRRNAMLPVVLMILALLPACAAQSWVVRPGAKPVVELGELAVAAEERSLPQAYYFLPYQWPPDDVLAMIDKDLPADVRTTCGEYKSTAKQILDLQTGLDKAVKALADKPGVDSSKKDPAAEQHYGREVQELKKKFETEVAALEKAHVLQIGRCRDALALAAKGSSNAALHLELALAEWTIASAKYIEAKDVFDVQMRDYEEVRRKDEPAEPVRDVAATISACNEVAKLRPVEDPIGWHARYRRAVSKIEIGEYREALKDLLALAAAPPQSGTAEVLTRIGEYYFDQADPPDYPNAVSYFSMAAELSKTPHSPKDMNYGDMARFKVGWAHFRSGNWAEAWNSMLGFGANRDNCFMRPEVVRFAIAAADRMHVVQLGKLKDAKAGAAAEIAMGIAERAARRMDCKTASWAWRLALEKAPDSIRAPEAVSGLAACAGRTGSAAEAGKLTERFATEYGPKSAWAEKLRAKRDKDGRPTDDEIAKAATAKPTISVKAPESEDAKRAESLTRISRLAATCLADVRGRAVADAEIEVRAEVLDDDAAVSAMVLGGDRSALEPVVGCIQKIGPSFFVDAPQSVRATIRLEPAKQ